MPTRSLKPHALYFSLLALTLNPVLAHSGARLSSVRVMSPNGQLAAEVRKQAQAGDSVWVGRSRLWAAEGSTTRVTGTPVWSRRGDALAFVVKKGRGQEKLVVALVTGDAAPATLSWPLPSLSKQRRIVTWIGPRRVTVGNSQLAPQVVASWQSRAQ